MSDRVNCAARSIAQRKLATKSRNVLCDAPALGMIASLDSMSNKVRTYLETRLGRVRLLRLARVRAACLAASLATGLACTDVRNKRNVSY